MLSAEFFAEDFALGDGNGGTFFEDHAVNSRGASAQDQEQRKRGPQAGQPARKKKHR